MRALSAQDIVELWEVGRDAHPIERALLILSRAFPQYDAESLPQLSLGRRDQLLLEVRQELFGDALDARVECPSCAQALEVSTHCSALLTTAPEPTAGKTLELDGVQFMLRCPDSRDAAAAAACRDIAEARRVLIARCLVVAEHAEADAAADLSDASEQLVAAELAKLDPQAEVLFDLSCASCGHGWQTLFDVGSFLWTEICARARRLLQEVDTLARVYHWSELDILQLSDARRATYLHLALS